MAMAQVTSTGGATAPANTTPAATAKTTGTTASTGTAPAFKDDLAKATEKLQPVPRHGRAKIVAGEREGQYLNTSGNKRDGQAFKMEYHNGRRWHVYGTGADRVVIAFAKPAQAAAPKTGGAGGTEAAKPATSSSGGASATTVPTVKDGTGASVPAVAQTSKTFSTTRPSGGGAVALP